MSHSFSEQDRYDLKEMFRIYDFSKVERVDSVVEDAEKNGTAPSELFDNLYTLYKIRKLPQREAVTKRLHMAVSTASDADVESVLRQTEMKGFSERDAVRSLERKHNVQHVTNRSLQAARSNLTAVHDAVAATEEPSELLRTTSQLRHVIVNESSTSMLSGSASPEAGANEEAEASVIFARPPSRLTAAPTRENLDEVIAEEVREWLSKMLGDAYNSDVLAMPNFVDPLRNGVLLHVLLQKMQDPPVPDSELKLPKRATGFFIRDNVATFLKEAKRRFSLVDAQLFTDSDLVDGKSDRQVVTCLMAMARIAYSAGTIKVAPNIIMYEHEIEQQGNRLTKTDLDRIVNEAVAKEEDEEAELPVTTLQSDDDERRATHDGARFPSMPAQSGDGKALSTAQVSRTTSAQEAAPMEADAAVSGGLVTPPPAAVQDATLDDMSPPATVDRTSSPTTSKASRDHSATPVRNGVEKAVSRGMSPVAVAVQDDATPAKAAEKKRTSQPASEDLHTPEERGMSPAEATHSASPPPSQQKSTEAPSEAQQHDEQEDDDDDGSGGGGGRVFYLRDGALRPTKPTPAEESELQKQRRKAPPRVVWKSPSSPLAATRPPRYHSRHWDGIDIALSHHLNAHYEANPQSPWRFHMVASTSGEYVLYNRQNAQKRVVYLRLIQTRLFVRNAGKNQPWIRIDEALANLENAE